MRLSQFVAVTLSFGAGAGLGYDIRLQHLYITPNLDWMFETVEPAVGATTTNHMLLATLGITWH